MQVLHSDIGPKLVQSETGTLGVVVQYVLSRLDYRVGKGPTQETHPGVKLCENQTVRDSALTTRTGC